MAGIGTELIIILLLLVANGVFAMSEISIVAARKVRLQQRAEEGDLRARAALRLANDPAQFLSTVQVGITLVGILAGAYGGATIAEQLAARLATVPILADYADAIGLAIVVAGITYLSLIIGELVPKNIGLRSPETIAAWVAGPMSRLARIGAPVIWLLTVSTNLVLRLFGMKGGAEPGLTENEIRAVISEGALSGVLEAAEETIVQRVFQLGDRRAAALMTPRVRIDWLDVHATTSELREFLATHNHTRFVVCDRVLDNVVGTVRAAQLLPIVLGRDSIELASLVREPLFVPDTMKAFQLLEAFRGSHRHLAIVMDEFGAVEGLVTVTDILEGIVGDLPADAKEAEGPFTARGDGSWLVEGAAPMDEVARRFALEDRPIGESGDYRTIGGFVMTRLGRIPRPSDTFEWGGYRFEVVDMDGRRVDMVLMTRCDGTDDSTDGD